MSDPLEEIIALRGAHPLPSTQERALAALRTAVSADAALLVESGPTVTLLAGVSPSPEILENLIRTAAPIISSAVRGKVIVKKFTFRDQQVHMIAESCGAASAWLIVWVRTTEKALESVSQVIRLAAQCLPVGSSGTNAEAQAALELIASFSKPRLARMRDFAEKICGLIGGKSVILARRKLRGWRIVACFPSSAPAARSSLHESLMLALSAHGADEHPAVFPPEGAHPALPDICRITESQSCAVVPAWEGWALIAIWDSPLPPAEELHAAVAPLAPMLPSLYRHARSVLARWKSVPFNRRRLWGVLAAAVAILLIFPFHMRVRSPAILEPSLRRFVAVPFDSVLKKVHVAAGDVVEMKTLLAELDGKEVRERIAEIESQAAAANLQSASDLAGSRFDESALSSLQAQRAGHELEVLRERERNLRILAPIAGVVIQGDLEREEGAALKLGHSIMEIAPLDTMVVEAALREDDAPFVHAGQTVTVRLNALPSRDIRAVIKKVDPRAETRDGRNVFIAEAEVPNADGNLRPGMKGNAVIVAERMPFFWILFRKPWNALRSWLFW